MSTLRALALTAAGLVALFAGHSSAQPTKPPATDTLPIPSEKEAMTAKRQYAHAILDALTAGDHNALRLNAEVLAAVADMRVFTSSYKTEEYQFQAKVFKRAADDLLKAAKAKNSDLATVAYADLTRTCVKCHSHYRGVGK